MTFSPFHRRSAMLAALAVVQACSSGGNTGGTPAVSITISSSSGSIAQGGSTTIGVTGTGSGGFTGPVTFAVTGLPAGATFSVSNVQTTGSATTASILLSIGATVATGNYPLTFTASGSGVSNANASYSLTVTSSSVPGYTLSALPTAISIAQGATGNSTITITRTSGFAGSVALTATGMSSGLTAAFSPTSTTGNTSTLTLTATAGASTGTVTITIHGTATGLADQTTTIQVTVTASGGGNLVRLDFTGCTGILKPIWLAFQDGTGPWTQVVPTGDVYQFTIASAKGGWAQVSQSGSQTITAVHLLTQAELTASSVAFCPATTTKTVNVTVAGLSTGLFANLSLGGGNTFALTDGAYPIPSVKSGPQDFVGYRTAVIAAPAATDRAVIIRDLDVAAGGSLGTADFGGASAITPITGTITVSNPVAGDAIVANMGYLTGTSCGFGALYTLPSSASPVLSMFGIPAASQRPTDFHYLQVFARNGSTATRTLALAFNAFADRTVTLGGVPATPTITDLGLAAYKRLQGAGTVPTDYSTSTALIYTQHGTAISAVITATQGWLGGFSVTLAFPDFTAVSGWTNSWAPAAGMTADWTWLSNFVNYTTLCTEGAKLLAGQVTGSM
jgi:hypothetical protein